MRAHEILLEYGNRSRSKPLTVEEFNQLRPKIEIALQKAEQGVRIYRGVDTRSKMMYTDPTGSERVSANTTNTLTLLLSHMLPSWKSWPKRSRSLICSGDYEYASSYSPSRRARIVLPIGNPDIGIVPASDFWYGFPTATTPPPDEFNRLFMMFYKNFDEFFNRNVIISGSNTDQDLLMRELKAIDQAVANDPEDMKKLIDKLNWTSGHHLKMIKMLASGDVIKSIDKYYNPDSNDFELTPLSGLTVNNNEMWFSAPAVLIHPVEFDKLMN